MTCFVMTSCPQPRHSVDLLPSYSAFGRPSRFVFGAAGVGSGGGRLGAHRGQPFFPDVSRSERTPSTTVVASRGRPLYWRTGTKRVASSGNSSRRIVTSCAVAVLLDDVDALVAPDPRRRLGADRERAEAAVVERHAELGGEPVATLGHAVVRRAEREDPGDGARAGPGSSGFGTSVRAVSSLRARRSTLFT